MSNDVLVSKSYLLSKVIPLACTADDIQPHGYVMSDVIHKAPPIDVEPIVNAAWILNVSEHGKMLAVCGECERHLPVIITDSATGRFKPPKRCLECGAHMLEVIEYDARV